MKLGLLALLFGSASAFQAAPLSRVAKAPLSRPVATSAVTASLKLPAGTRDIVEKVALASLVAGAVAVAPAHAEEFVKAVPGSAQIGEFIIPSGAKASAQGILGPPGAIFFAFIGIFTATTLGTAPLKDGLPGRKMK